MPDPLDDVAADPTALAALRAAAARPVHAYLLVGPPGTGTMEAALGFAAMLLRGPAPGSGPGRGSERGPGPERGSEPGPGPGAGAGKDETVPSEDETVRRVLAGVHPDVVVVEREGASISVDAAHEVTRLAARSPVEGARKVLILNDFHLVREAGPALLKTIEEPPPSTVFVVRAEYLPPELVTIASRCVRIDFAPLARSRVVDLLVADGIQPGRAAELADVAGGRLDRARLLAADPDFERRRLAWMAVPDRLDGSGAAAAALAGELMGLLDASVAPLRARQEAELAALEERNARAAEINGKVGRGARGAPKTGVRELEERHKREVRRQRTDELRSGLAVLAGAYRDRLGAPATRQAAIAAVGAIDDLGEALVHNVGELLALQALFVRIGRPPA